MGDSLGGVTGCNAGMGGCDAAAMAQALHEGMSASFSIRSGSHPGASGTNGVLIAAAGWPSNGGPALESACVADPAACAAIASTAALSGDTPQPPAGVGPVRGDQNPNVVNNTVYNHLTPDDLNAARAELQGKNYPKPSGGNYNHIQEVQEAQQALRNRINYVKRVLSNPNLTEGQRYFYERDLSNASTALDYSRGFVP